MPAHITHIIFGEETLKQSIGAEADRIISRHGNIFRFACQGPDFFYHNQRTKPSGLKYGSLLHHEHYGRFTINMIRILSGSAGDNSETTEQIAAFILGFTTHAILDRKAHPFIAYFSGWVEKGNKETEKYFRCHPFFERIIDQKILKIRRNINITEFDTGKLMYCGSSIPGRIAKTFTDALKVTFPVFSRPDDLKRFGNAYRDTLFLYEITNPTKPIFYEMALIKDMDENYRKRRITLFYTEKLPEDIDYLNLNHSKWSHPCDNKDIRNSSFPEIYETALKVSEPVLSRLWNILKTIANGSEVSEDALREMEREIKRGVSMLEGKKI